MAVRPEIVDLHKKQTAGRVLSAFGCRSETANLQICCSGCGNAVYISMSWLKEGEETATSCPNCIAYSIVRLKKETEFRSRVEVKKDGTEWES
jgi:formate dehydrogenase maturation protein FdhE